MVVGFDDLPGVGGTVPFTYAGLQQWNNFSYFNASASAFGYLNSAVSAPKAAFNPTGGTSSIYLSTPFDVNSVYLTAGWRDGLQVRIDGYRLGSLLYSNTYSADTTHATYFLLNYQGVDQVFFTSFGGTPVYGDGLNFAMDDLTLTIPAPEPRSFALLVVAIVGLVGARLRAS